MTEKSKKRLFVTSVVTLLPMIAGIVLWNRLPEKIATHFNNYGEPNGWSSKAFTVFGLPLFLFVINIICAVTTETDPRRSRYPEKMMRLIYWIPAAVSWLGMFSIYSYCFGLRVEHTGIYASVFAGLLFLIMGNYMPKVKQNFFLGIKLPWTYTDEDNWNKTHRFAGRLWVVCGIVMIAGSFFGIVKILVWLILAAVILPSAYSWAYWMKKNKKGGNES